MKFGIIGLGRFGQLWAEALLPFGPVLAYDKDISSIHNKRVEITTLQNVTQADIVFILVPISEFEHCCQQIKKFLKLNTLVVDCCSVKMHTVKIMQQEFSSSQAMMATHPLFGPDSVKKSGGLKDHKIVVCSLESDEQIQVQLKEIFIKMGLNILMTTPEEHDEQMANSQGLVHFIGRGLAALDLHPQQLATPDFQALLNINNMVINDTWQLFLDMQRYNPFTNVIRQKLIQQLIKLDNQCKGE